ncbi:MAG: RNA polymerase sigma factor RpoD/SigA [bacterium]|nr:RNA polymerase sigma factor RpoD/SigA [bacterium]
MGYTNMTDDEVFSSLLPTIKNIYKAFKYTGISFDDYSDIVLDEISEMDGKVEETVFKNKLKKRMNNEVSKMLTDSDTASRIISSYLDVKVPKVDSYESAMKAFKKLDSFFSKYDFFMGRELLIDLLSNNEKFSSMTSYILKEKEKDIALGKSEDIFDSDFLIYTVKTYFELHGMPIKERKEEIDMIGFDSSSDLDIVSLYINELNAPLLSEDEEKALLVKIKQGDMEAREKFIESNLRLVVSVAKKFLGRGVPFLDLVQEGNLGLMKAIDKFDLSYDVRFSTYAVYRIKMFVSRAIADQSRNIRVPISRQDELYSYMTKIDNLEKKFGMNLSIDEISMMLGKSVDKIRELESLKNDTVSINALVGKDNDTELGEFLSTSESIEDEVIDSFLPEQIMELLKKSKLSEREKDVLLSRFGIGRSHVWQLKELSKKYGVSKAWIGQVELNALEKLRHLKSIEQFSVYMDNPDLALRNLEEFRKKPEKRERRKTGKRGSLLKSIYEYFDDFSREDVDSVLDDLNEFDKNLVFLRYGEDLDNPVSTTLFGEEETKKFYGALVPRMRKKLYALQEEAKPNNKNNIKQDVFLTESLVTELNRDEYTKLIQILKKPDVIGVMTGLSMKEKIIVSLRLGYVDGKHFSVDAISDFLGLSNHDIIKTSVEFMTKHSDKVDSILNKAMDFAFDSDASSSSKILIKDKNTDVTGT